jgi:hypothetical protein
LAPNEDDLISTPLEPVSKVVRPSGTKKPLAEGLEKSAIYLYNQFGEFFASKYDLEASYLTIDEVLDMQDVRMAVLATKKGYLKDSVEKLMGGGMVEDQMELFHTWLEEYCYTQAYQEYNQLKNIKKRPSTISKKTNPKSQSLVPSAVTLGHLDPSLFGSTSSLRPGLKKTKRQLIAKENKKNTSAKQEMKKVQKAVDEQKKKEASQRKIEEHARKREADEMNKKEKLDKQMAKKDATIDYQAKQRRTKIDTLDRFHSGAI